MDVVEVVKQMASALTKHGQSKNCS